MRTPKVLIPCAVCHHDGAKSGIQGVCLVCYTRAHKQARAEQERDYLAQWLASRVDEKGRPLGDSALTATLHDVRQITRLVRLARKTHTDWRTPPASLAFELRVRNALGLGRSNKSRKKKTA